MSGTSGIGTLLIAAGALILGFATRPVLGLSPDEAATIAILAGIGLLMTGRVIDAFRQRGTLGIHALILWSLAFGGLVTMFVQREASLAIVDRFIGEVAAGRAVDNGFGEVVVARRADGSFTLAGHVNGRGARFVFDLAPARFQIRALAGLPGEAGPGARGERVLPLLEGENVLGRRRSAQKYEHRLTLSGDELISADHALLSYGDEDRVTLRDSSKNGTWITPPGGVEERLRGERTIVPGTLLRVGATRLRLERREEG